jgi:hypothetical protein
MRYHRGASRASIAARLVLGTVLGAVAIACGRGPAPPRPDHVTTPDSIGVLLAYESVGCVGRFHLDTEEVVELHFASCGPPKAPRAIIGQSGWTTAPRNGDHVEHGSLMLFGEDEIGPWYVAAADVRRDGRCYSTTGSAYREGDLAHFSTGLELPIAATFTWSPPIKGAENDAFPLRDGDDICLDRGGTLISVVLPTDR